MTDERKQALQAVAQKLRCISTPCGNCEGSKCRFWSEEETPEEFRHEMGDTWGGCDAVGMTGADAIQELLSEVERLEEANMELRIKMRGDCGVCAHRNDPKMCAVCLGHKDRPAWAYEGSSL